MFTDGLPLKPGGILKPRIGLQAVLCQGGAVQSKQMHDEKRVTNGESVTAAPVRDMAKVATTSPNGKAESGEAHAHAHPLPAPNSAVATKERANNAPGKARSASSPRPSESEKDHSRKSYHQRRKKAEK
eukprot:774484-Pyramimonas_sp.AAC.2